MSTLRVKSAFAVQDRDGAVHVYAAGRLVEEGDPILDGRELLFEPVEVVAARMSGAETATAAPGEQRTRTAPRKRASKKPRKTAASKKAAATPAPAPAASPSSEQV
jgi:hypothetical protein